MLTNHFVPKFSATTSRLFTAIAFPTLNPGPQEELLQALQGCVSDLEHHACIPLGQPAVQGACRTLGHWDLGGVLWCQHCQHRLRQQRKQTGQPGEMFIHFTTVIVFTYQAE